MNLKTEIFCFLNFRVSAQVKNVLLSPRMLVCMSSFYESRLSLRRRKTYLPKCSPNKEKLILTNIGKSQQPWAGVCLGPIVFFQ